MQTDLEKMFVHNCFCERLNIMQLAFGWQEIYQDKCPDYLENVNNYYYGLPAYGLVVSGVNNLFNRMVFYTSKWMRFQDITSEATF